MIRTITTRLQSTTNHDALLEGREREGERGERDIAKERERERGETEGERERDRERERERERERGLILDPHDYHQVTINNKS